MCKRFVFEGICGFGDMCSYNHKKILNQHGSDKDELKEDIKNLKVEVEYLKESIKICISSRKESETLEKSLNELKADIKLLTVKNKELMGGKMILNMIQSKKVILSLKKVKISRVLK